MEPLSWTRTRLLCGWCIRLLWLSLPVGIGLKQFQLLAFLPQRTQLYVFLSGPTLKIPMRKTYLPFNMSRRFTMGASLFGSETVRSRAEQLGLVLKDF